MRQHQRSLTLALLLGLSCATALDASDCGCSAPANGSIPNIFTFQAAPVAVPASAYYYGVPTTAFSVQTAAYTVTNAFAPQVFATSALPVATIRLNVVGAGAASSQADTEDPPGCGGGEAAATDVEALRKDIATIKQEVADIRCALGRLEEAVRRIEEHQKSKPGSGATPPPAPGSDVEDPPG